MSINSTSLEILNLCKNDELPYREYKEKQIKLLDQLESIVIKSNEEVNVLISLHNSLSKIKNRKASYLEEEIARLTLLGLPFSIRSRDKNIPEDTVEELHECSDQREALKMSATLLRHSKEVLASKPEKSKRYKKRVKEAIRLLDKLQQFYKIIDIKDIFKSKMEDSDHDLQFFALYGLENYFAYETTDKLTKEEELKLERIIESTDMRETASTCCQILIHTGKIDEIGAMMKMDKWKAKNWSQ